MTEMILLREWQASQVEFWRKTKYEGYDVSSFGRVRSWRGKRTNGGHANGFHSVRLRVPHVLQIATTKSRRYCTVDIKGHTRTVHRLVALAFLSNPDDLPQVNHITGFKGNNWLDNLEWKTRSGNMEHAFEVGLRPNAAKKLKETDIREIRKRALGHETRKAIGASYGVSSSSISAIVKRITWRHVQ